LPLPDLLKEVLLLYANEISEQFPALLILVGTIFTFLSAVGLIRFPDLYTRSHAASKSSTLGVLCTLLGTLCYFWISEGYFSIRLILGIFFVFLTTPVAAHVMCRAAYRSNLELADESIQDDLKEVFERENG